MPNVITAAALAPQSQVVQLPSQTGTDDAVRLQKAPVLAMMNENGDIADLLTRVALDEGAPQTAQDGINMLPDVQQLNAFLNTVALACFVEPQLQATQDPDEGFASVHWLSFGDKMFVFQWALGGQFNKLVTFPGEQNGGAQSVSPDGIIAEGTE